VLLSACARKGTSSSNDDSASAPPTAGGNEVDASPPPSAGSSMVEPTAPSRDASPPDSPADGRPVGVPTGEAGASVYRLDAGMDSEGEMGDGGAITQDTTPTGWSCATAAGVCSCVEVGGQLDVAANRCAASDCCFVDVFGGCSCVLATASMSCAALFDALAGEREVSSCPTL